MKIAQIEANARAPYAAKIMVLESEKAALLATLQDCIPDPGAVCFTREKSHPEYMRYRIDMISELAEFAIAQATKPPCK